MDKIAYVGVAVVVIIVIAGIVLLAGKGSSNTQTTVQTTVNQASTIQAGNQSTSIPTTYKTTSTTPQTNQYNTTTSVPPSNSTVSNSTLAGCSASKYFTCTNASLSTSNKVTYLTFTLGQSTGTSWSSFGVAYAPKGTAISQGVPAAAFYTGNVSSTNNVGPGLNNTRTIRLTIPVNTTKGGGVLGAIWACYGNSGLLYVGSAGCITNGGGGGVPTYVEVATVNIA